MAPVNCNMFTHESESICGMLFQLLYQNKDFSRLHAVTYTEQLVISRKQYNIETQLQWKTIKNNRKS